MNRKNRQWIPKRSYPEIWRTEPAIKSFFEGLKKLFVGRAKNAKPETRRTKKDKPKNRKFERRAPFYISIESALIGD